MSNARHMVEVFEEERVATLFMAGVRPDGMIRLVFEPRLRVLLQADQGMLEGIVETLREGLTELRDKAQDDLEFK